MWDFRRIFGEDSIERRHNTNNHYSRALSCVHRWFDRLILREKRIGFDTFNPEVAKSCLHAISSTKRDLNDEHKTSKRAKTTAKD